MGRMKRGPIGVWFSVALAIIVLGYCAGWYVGDGIANYSNRYRGGLSRPEQDHLDSMLSELNTFADESGWPYVALTFDLRMDSKKDLTGKIARLAALRLQADAREITPEIDLAIGLAHVEAAMAEEQDNNPQAAAEHIESAQMLFQTLGWQDCSKDALKAVAQRELDKRSAERREAARQRETGKSMAHRRARQYAK
jgi:hypothetical protein